MRDDIAALIFRALCGAFYAALIACIFELPLSWSAPSGAGAHVDLRGPAMSPELQLALRWVRRTQQLDTRHWYVDPTPTPRGVVGANASVSLEEGQVVLPLHALYLCGVGAYLRLVRPDHVMIPDDTHEANAWPPLQGHDNQVATSLQALLKPVAFAIALVLMLVAEPAVWRLARDIAQLLVKALEERERAAQQATGTAAVRRTADELLAMRTRLTVIAAVTINLVGLGPAFVLEVTTLYPISLCVTATLVVFHLLLHEECQSNPGVSGTVSTSSGSSASGSSINHNVKEAYVLDRPVLKEGDVYFFPAKHATPLLHLSLAAALVAGTALTHYAFVYTAPLFLFWILTICYQRGFRRVFVRVKVPDGVHTAEACADGFVDIGFSCYRDMRSAVRHAATVLLPVSFLLATLGFVLCATPESAFTTLGYLGRTPYPAETRLPRGATTPTAVPSKTVASVTGGDSSGPLTPADWGPSLTGAHELRPQCLADLQAGSGYFCSRPTVNLWALSEYYGFPWSDGVAELVALLTFGDDWQHTTVASPRQRRRVLVETQMWLDYLSIVAIVFCNAPSLFTLLAYRLRRPPLNFETPLQFAQARTLQRQRFLQWQRRQQRTQMAGAGKNGAAQGKHTLSSSSSSSSPAVDVKVVTCVSREEYLVKQVALLGWMTILCALSCTLLLLRSGPLGAVAALPALALVAALYVMIEVLRRACPLAFSRDAAERDEKDDIWSSHMQVAPDSSRTTRGVTGGYSAEAKTRQDAAFSVAPTGEEGMRTTVQSRPSRWCAAATTALSEQADLLWVTAALLALALGGEVVMCDALVPAVARHWCVAGLAASFGLQLLRLRAWSRFDLSGLFFLGAAHVLMLYLTFVTMHMTHAKGGLGEDGGLWVLMRRYLRQFSSYLFAPSVPPVIVTAGNADGGEPGMGLVRTFVQQCALAAVLLVMMLLHAVVRVARLAFEVEEVRFSLPTPSG